MSAKEDNEIKNYWSKLLIFIIIIAFGYLSYYKFFIHDKRDVNNNNVIKKEENNSKEKNDTKSKPTDADNSNTEDENDILSKDTLENYFLSNNIKVKTYVDLIDFADIVPIYESTSPEKSEIIYQNAMKEIKSILEEEYGNTVKFNLYKIDSCYIVAFTQNEAVGEINDIIILNKEFKKIADASSIYYVDGKIYYQFLLGHGRTDANIEEDIRNNPISSYDCFIYMLYKVDTNTGEKNFVDYVEYDGAMSC